MTITNVVVGVDDSVESRAAERWAGRYAEAAGVPLRVLHADAEPVAALVEASSGSTLLVLGARDRGRLTAALFGSVSGQVAVAAAGPVVVVREEVDPPGPVVVAVDAAGTSDAAVLFAFEEAARRGRELHAVHAWPVPALPSGAGSTGVMTSTRYLPDAALAVLATAVAAGRAAFPQVIVHERLVTGHPEEVVPDETTDAAMLVVGSRGRTPLTGLLLGSTSQALLHRSTGPVAVVRTENVAVVRTEN
ncbi:universal stress protein [Actinoplanes bogorensis]|uniref:Universal stress protein n=1 Tax=Paractinoplanes bogorensis TaxID=1610840 RepID=A0ABS5YZ16_9ACTN|nr:universal stress protein [Actinoplanes bogorensis]MBU2667953.1 universal stress protein [Actinoplanes bogorensis]